MITNLPPLPPVPPVPPVQPGIYLPPNGILSAGLVMGSDDVSVLIERFTRSPYSHALLILPDGSLWESAPGKGVQHLPSFAAAYGDQKVDVFQMPLSDAQTAAILAFCQSRNGTPYAWKGDAAFVTGGGMGDPDPGSLFCSEFVFAAFQAAPIDLLANIPAWLVPPAALAYPTPPWRKVAALNQASFTSLQ